MAFSDTDPADDRDANPGVEFTSRGSEIGQSPPLTSRTDMKGHMKLLGRVREMSFWCSVCNVGASLS